MVLRHHVRKAALPIFSGVEGMKRLGLLAKCFAQCFQQPKRLLAVNNVSSRPFGLAECCLWLGAGCRWGPRCRSGTLRILVGS